MCGAGQLLARVPAAARRVRRGHRAAGLRDADARADGYTDLGAHAAPDDVQDAVYKYTDLGAYVWERVARAFRPAEPAADAAAFLQTHGGAHSAADEPRAFINAVAHTDGATHGDADARSDARTDARARAGADAAADARAIVRTVVEPVAAAYDQSDPRAGTRAHVNTIAPAVVGTSAGADVRSHGSTVRRTHVEADVKTLAAADDRFTNDLDALGRADEPPFRTAILTTPTRAHAQADGRADAHGGPDAAGPLLRLRPDPDGLAPLLVDRGRRLRPEHRRDL